MEFAIVEFELKKYVIFKDVERERVFIDENGKKNVVKIGYKWDDVIHQLHSTEIHIGKFEEYEILIIEEDIKEVRIK